MLLPRLHLFEICDQPWVPEFLIERLQTILTLLWLLRVPILQSHSPAALASKTLHLLLSTRLHDHVYVDFCAGGGGPTPWIAEQLRARGDAVDFVLTDISPHIPAWRLAASRDANIHYIRRSVNAAAPSKSLLHDSSLVISPLAAPDTAERLQKRSTFGLFFLAFHHFPDELARDILRAALDTSTASGGFAIFELQGRTFQEILMVLAIGPLVLLIAPFYFWNDPVMLFFIYIFPVIPLILMFDGTVSCLRTRTEAEIMELIRQSGADLDCWEIKHGFEVHTWPLGRMRWTAAIKRDSTQHLD